MKNFLYNVKNSLLYLFQYPVDHLVHTTVDYDAYWVDKRGENLGVLSRWQKQRADLMLRYLNPNESMSIVDVGCGDGSVLAYLRTKTNLKRAIGVDVSSTALVKARTQGIETLLVGKVLEEAVDVIPEADHVLLLEVLEHMPDAEKFLQTMHQKARGGVFFSFPNTGYFLHRFRLLLGRFPLQWRLHPSEHLRFWTYHDLRWWLEALGYRTYHIHVYEGVPVLKRLLPSLFGKGLLVYLPKDQERK